jgi:hypothetical protein
MGLSVDWNSVFVPAIGLAEIVVRGSLMYLGLFVIMPSWREGRRGISDPQTFSSSS